MKFNLESQLKQLQSIQPRAEFVQHSRKLLLLEKPTSRLRFNFFEQLKMSGALVLASLLLFVLAGSISYFAGGKNKLADLNQINSAEADSPELDIRLQELKYFEELTKEIERIENAIEELTDKLQQK